MPRIAILGSLALDHLDVGERVGGGAFHGARGLRLLGGDGIVLTQTARPELLAPLEALGLPVRAREASSQSTFSLHYDGDARTMLVEEVGEPWRPGPWLAEALDGIEWVHVAPLHRSDFPAATLRELAHGRRVMLDGQGLVRVPETGPLQLDADYDPEVLRHVAMLKLAEEEALALLPRIDEETIAGLGVEEVLVTYGGEGSTLYTGGTCTEVPADRVEAESTGAGDAFCAAYVSSRAAGAPPLEAARRATALVHRMLAGA
jgi:sugar/nucleoside kinase (ribokinase family)